MASRNHHLYLEQPFEELSQRRPRRAPVEHNVLKARDTTTLTGAAFPIDEQPQQLSQSSTTTPELPATPKSANTSTSIRVLNIRRDVDVDAYPVTSPSPATPGYALDISSQQDVPSSQPPPPQHVPPPPRYGRRSAEPHERTEQPRTDDAWTRSAPRLHLDFDDATVGRAAAPLTAATPTREAVSSVQDPHEAAVAALRLRERPSRLTARAGAAPGTPSQRSSSKTGLPPRHLPPAQEKPWLQGLDNVVTGVWATLGFLALPPSTASSQTPVGKVTDSSTFIPPVSVEDQALFVAQLRFYFAAGGKGLERVACTSASLGNALWYVVFNAVYYCVGVLGSAYAPVNGSSESSLENGLSATVAPSMAPTPLVWRSSQCTAVHFPHSRAHSGDGVPASLGEHLRELARHVRPAPEPRRRTDGGPRPQRHADTESSILSEAGASSVWSTEAGEEADPSQYANALSAATPFSAADWLFVVRYMACIGYQRDAFYLQTPANASPQELVLALLWLTKKYQLLAVAEYVELNVRFPFLLVHHTDPAALLGTRDADSDARAQGDEKDVGGERLLLSFPRPSVWPPASFDENQAIDRRLHVLQRLLGGSSEDAARVAGTGASALLRRLLAVRRQVDLSLSRVEKALHQRTDQVRFLGLHSPLDAQLCLPEFDAAYRRLLAGLKHVRGMEDRTRERVGHLAAAGDLVAYALRHHRSASVPAESAVLDGLEEDAATWLGALPGGDDRHPARRRASSGSRRAGAVALGALPAGAADVLDGSRLHTALSKFRVTRTKQYLADLWRSLARRAQMEPTTTMLSSPPHARGQAPERAFAADPHAQRSHQGQVRRSLTARYSFQAALAAEMLLLQEGDADSSAMARAGGDAREATGPFFSLETLPLDLTCSAHAQFQKLLHRQPTSPEDASAEPHPLPASLYQLTEVGTPAPTATTSARLELRRLTALLEQVEAASPAQAQHGEAAVATLRKVYRLRPAQTIQGGQ